MLQKLFISFLLIFINTAVFAQSCPLSSLGQNPSTAFPVCGTTNFIQNSVPLCGSTPIIVPGCNDGALYSDRNPYWYKFTCYASGTLAFLVKPNNQGDDYDWQLYDVTNRDVNQVFQNPTWVVAANWAGTYGNTGASSAGISGIQCASIPSDNRNSFAQMPTLIIGHQYLLLISHYTDTQSGYTLSFGGGTAVITDPLLPKLLTGSAFCDARQIKIKLNKKIKCSSLAANGSDFSINSPGIQVISAVAPACGSSFDMDSVILTLNNPLPPGTFTVSVKFGTDNNTLLDNCDRGVPVGDQVSFTVLPLIPTPMDSLTAVKCAPQTLELIFRKPMLCNTIAANGSDFSVTGPTAVTITGAQGNCDANGLSKTILVQLSTPLQVGGTYRITLKVGSDGNTILDECSQQTPAGSFINFNIKDTVNANFTYNILYGCKQNAVQYLHNGANGITNYNWTFDNTGQSNLQNPILNYTNFNDKNTRLIVSNGVCSDTSSMTIKFDNLLEASFSVTPVICPNEPVTFTNNTVSNNITEWRWNFGNGNVSSLKNPAAQLYVAPAAADYIALPQLIVKNTYGCYDTATAPVKVVFSCFIAVPTAFTPNNDGLNDYLYPLVAYKATKLQFSIYNRFGERVFYSENWEKKWNGRYKERDADVGTYVWVLRYTHSDTGKQVEQKGTSILIR